VRLRPVVNGDFRVAEEPLAAAAATVSRHLGRPVEVEPACRVELNPDVADWLTEALVQAGTPRPVEPTDILVVPAAGDGVTGYLTWRDDPALEGSRVAVVVVHPEAIERVANPFVKAGKLLEWTLTHEIGHALGVPASHEHMWIVPGLGGHHCTHPECVMYTGFDW